MTEREWRDERLIANVLLFSLVRQICDVKDNATFAIYLSPHHIVSSYFTSGKKASPALQVTVVPPLLSLSYSSTDSLLLKKLPDEQVSRVEVHKISIQLKKYTKQVDLIVVLNGHSQ